MKISGFTFIRNAVDLDYPIVEAISSILPICDEFVVSAGDSTDGTTELIRSLGDPKIKIIESPWKQEQFVHGATNAYQTNKALNACAGDWCFYLQGDEVIHEKYLPIIVDKCRCYVNDSRVEGFLFDYKHFWGDYYKYQTAHHWYRREVRVVRNGIGVKSWQSAQGFRRQGKKLRVVHSGAEVYHYGWVRHPLKMKKKCISLASLHHPRKWVNRKFPAPELPFEYGSLKHLATFEGTHPKVMAQRIATKDWKVVENPMVKHRHNLPLVRLLSFIENRIFHTRIGEYKNYILVDDT